MRKLKDHIEINNNSKGKICCSSSIDISRGCINQCEGCYSLRSGIAAIPEIKQRRVFYKNYDAEKFKKSCSSFFNKGQRNIRLGKFSEPGDPANYSQLDSILTETKNQKLKLVMVSKSVTYTKYLSKKLKNGSHTVHISLGMDPKFGPTDEERINTYLKFKKDGVNSKVRLTVDVSKPMSSLFKKLDSSDIIITPMRYISKELLLSSGSKLENYEYSKGYYRVKSNKIHQDYNLYSFCGSIGDRDFCSKCKAI